MTCIIGLEHNGKVYMGGDSAAVGDYYDFKRVVSPKVFTIGNMIIGYTDSFRMGQLLQYSLALPGESYAMDDMEYFVAHFIPAVRNCLRDGGYSIIENNREEGGLFLVGYRGRVYTVHQNFQVLRYDTGFACIGCGMFYAEGAMMALGGMPEMPPSEKITNALNIVSHLCTGVKQPFTILNL